MYVLDVNILVYAFRADTEPHATVAAWLNELVNSDEEFALPDLVGVPANRHESGHLRGS